MVIPRNAKRVFRGVLFDVYHWKQLMYDGKYETFERLRRGGTVQVIATKGNKVLMLKERQPAMKGVRIGMPGGQVSKKETSLQAARRELLEETGLVSNDWKFIHSYSQTAGDKIEWPVMLYVAKNCRKVVEPELDHGEKIRYEWVLPEKLLLLFGSSRDDLYIDFLRITRDAKRLKKFKQKLFG